MNTGFLPVVVALNTGLILFVSVRYSQENNYKETSKTALLNDKLSRAVFGFGRVRESNARLSDRLQEVKLENKALRQISADYERVKRVFGPEQVKAAVQADKQREQAEKGRKRPRRSLDWGGR